MYIEKLHIDTFGKLSDLDITLEEGLNIIEGPNESGKSTLASFIKFVLYGIPSREREAVLSWKSGGASGSITLASDNGEKRFRVERAILGNREAAQLIDANTNLPIKNIPGSVSIGEFLFSVNADMFSATAFISQLEKNSGGASVGGSKVSEGIENILFSADENINTQKAATKLDSARAALLHKNEKGGLLHETREECAKYEMRLSAATDGHKEIASLEGQLADLHEKLNDVSSKAKLVSEKVEKSEAISIIKLFDKAKFLREDIKALREKLVASDSEETVKLSELERTVANLNMLKEESEKLKGREKAAIPQASPTLEEYISRGGRQGLEHEELMLRTHSKTFLTVGILVFILGIAMMLVGNLPLLLHASPRIILITLGALAMAGGITCFILSVRKSSAARNILDEFDFDSLDSLFAKRKAAIEAEEFARLAADSAEQRYMEACARAEAKFGCATSLFEDKVSELTEKQNDYNNIKISLEKQKLLLSQVEDQIFIYNEEELRAKVGDDYSCEEDPEALQALRREADFFSKQAEALEKRCMDIEKALAGLYPTVENPTVVSDKLSELKERCTELAKKHAAYKLACEKLAEASDQLRSGVAPKLALDAAGLMAHITDGKYKELGVGSTLDMTVNTEGGLKSISVLSAGTKDAAYISLRLALVSLLYRENTPPMIYDEAFSRQDNTRLASIMKLIKIGSTQSIIFTSNNREASIAEALGHFNHIKM